MHTSRTIKLVGVNTARILSEFPSFQNWLNKLFPTIFFLQETKVKRPGIIKTESCSKYQVFELLRKSTGGGGLATEVLNPVLTYEGDNEVEILVLEIDVKASKIRLINAYGPQEKQKMEIKQKFWDRLECEVLQAQSLGCGLIFQMDGNLRAGSSIIPNDPNEQNKNGKLFANFLANHPTCQLLTVCLCVRVSSHADVRQ